MASREELRARTQGRMLAEAEREFLRRGYTAASLEVIADRAGVTRPALYKYFAGKEGLLLAVAEARLERDLAALSSSSAPAAEQWAGALELSGEMARWCLACAEFISHLDKRSPLRKRGAAMQRMAERALGAVLLEQCRARGVEPALPAEQLAAVVLSTLFGLQIRASLDATGMSGLAEYAIEALVRGAAPAQVQAVDEPVESAQVAAR